MLSKVYEFCLSVKMGRVLILVLMEYALEVLIYYFMAKFKIVS